MDQQVDAYHCGGVDSFRAPHHVGDSSALPGQNGIFFAGQPQDQGRPTTRQPGRSISIYQPAGEGSVARGDPVISVDAKKKELVGPFKNAGSTWQPKGKPKHVNTKDYPS